MQDENFNALEEQTSIKEVDELKPASHFLSDYYKTLGDGTSQFLGIETGLAQLDKETLGLDGLIVLGGTAGQGKTTLALQIAYEASKLGTPTIFYSLEMPKRAVLTKILNRLARVKYFNILLKGGQYLDDTRDKEQDKLNEEMESDFSKYLTETDKANLMKGKETLEKTTDKFYLRSRERGEKDINFETVENEINILKAKHKVEKILIVIDHLQCFNAGEYKDQIDKEGKIVNGFKMISENTGAVIILISQKNKTGFKSTGLEAIKGSVDIVYLADIVMFLQEEKKKKEEENEQIPTQGFSNGTIAKKIDLVLEKNRYNTPCTINFDFSGEFSEFTPRVEF